MPSAWLGRTPVILAFITLACHDASTATKSISGGGGGGVSGPPPYKTITVDGPVPYDAGPVWGGLNLLQGTDGSPSIVSMDAAEDRLRYAHCDTGCDARSAWTTLTVDSGGNDYFNSAAAIGPGGVYAVYQQSGQGIRYAHCASGCDTLANWQTSTLFGGFIGTNGPHVNPLAVDAGSGLNLVFQTVGPSFLYAHCASACGSGSSWTQVPLDSIGAEFSLVAEPSGRLDLIYVTYGGLTYLACDSSCTTAANWSRAVLVPSGSRSTSMVYSGGALHVAYADTINAVHYLTCSTGCTAPENWQGGLIGETSPNDVAIGASEGQITIATSQSQIVISRCSTACTNSASWQSVTVDSAGAAGGGYLSLGVDASGHPRLASTVNWLQYTHLTQ